MKAGKVGAVVLIVCNLVGRASGALILFSDTSNDEIEANTIARLEGLGHTVTVSDASTWGSSFDYSAYDLVAFGWACGGVADMNHFVDNVTNGTVGAVFMRGGGAEAVAIGLLSSTSMNYTTSDPLVVSSDEHPITSGYTGRSVSLGYTYRTYYSAASGTTVLGTLGGQDSLVVHDSWRAVAIPFYGHTDGFTSETADSVQLTSNAIDYVVVPEPASIALLGIVFVLGFFIRRRFLI